MDQQTDNSAVLDKWLEKAREEALKKEEQAAYEKAKQKRTRTIIVVLAAVLVVLFITALAGNLLLDIVAYAGMIFFYALFIAVYGSPIFYFCMYFIFGKMRNFKLAVVLSLLIAVGVVLAVMYLTKDSPSAEDKPLRYGEYPGLIGF